MILNKSWNKFEGPYFWGGGHFLNSANAPEIKQIMKYKGMPKCRVLNYNFFS